MTSEERIILALRLFEMNKALSGLRVHIDDAAEIAKLAGATDVAFATFHLSESIAVYASTINRYVTEQLSEP